MSSAHSPAADGFDRVDPVAGFRENASPVLAVKADFLAGPVTPRHRHRRAQLALLPERVLRVRTDNQLWVAAPGQAVWLPPGLIHQTWSDDRPSMRSLFIDPAQATMLAPKPQLLKVTPLLREIVCWLAEDGADQTGSPTWCRLAESAVELIQPLEVTAVPLPAPTSPRLMRIEDRIRAAPALEHSIGEHAGHEAMSTRSLLRLVQTQTGMSWRQWRRVVVLSEAMPRLVAGRSVGAVASELGFRSSGSFITAFKEVFGRTPGRFVSG